MDKTPSVPVLRLSLLKHPRAGQYYDGATQGTAVLIGMTTTEPPPFQGLKCTTQIRGKCVGYIIIYKNKVKYFLI